MRQAPFYRKHVRLVINSHYYWLLDGLTRKRDGFGECSTIVDGFTQQRDLIGACRIRDKPGSSRSVKSLQDREIRIFIMLAKNILASEKTVADHRF